MRATSFKVTGFSSLALCAGLAAPASPQGAGSVLATQKITEGEANFGGVLRDRDQFGGAVTNVGDLDGDGINELVVGMPGGDRGGQDSGAFWLLFMNDDVTVRSAVRVNDGRSGFTGPLDYTEAFGSAIANLGDLDGDGIDELGVGVPGNDGAPLTCFMINCDNGGYWVLFMNADGTVRAQTAQNGATQFGGEARTLNALGASIAGLGDLDGDTVPDLAVGAPGRGSGVLWVVFQNPDGSFHSRVRIGAGQGGFGDTLAGNAQFAASVASLGDLDGDGNTDIAVGAPFQGTGGTSGGVVWVLFLNADGSVRAEQRIDGSNGGFGGTLSDGDRFGSALSSIGDLDGDGNADLAVGAKGDDDGGTNRGAVWILFLEADGTVRDQVKVSDTSGGFTGILGDADLWGSSVGLWRANADGTVDLAVGAPRHDDVGIDRGAVWNLTLGTQACATASAQMLNGSGENPESLTWDTLARVGQPLELNLDCADYASGAAAVIGRGSPTSGQFTASGERLIDLMDKGVLPFRLTGQHLGGVAEFSVPIPADPALCGQALYVQGVCRGPSGPQLSNAVEFIIGD